MKFNEKMNKHKTLCRYPAQYTTHKILNAKNCTRTALSIFKISLQPFKNYTQFKNTFKYDLATIQQTLTKIT